MRLKYEGVLMRLWQNMCVVVLDDLKCSPLEHIQTVSQKTKASTLACDFWQQSFRNNSIFY